jgi:arginyl-tRNA synthetase
MSIVPEIKVKVAAVLKELYGTETTESELTINSTKPEFEGDYTLVLFSFVKSLKKSPEQLGNEIGDALVKAHPALFTGYNVIKGFLNLTVADNYWISFLQSNYNQPRFGSKPSNGQKVMVEYSSPNTNKPLHLGHLRNNFLGWSVAQILKESGYEIIKSCIVNDRGIHICKSMIAWQKFANGATPQSTGVKGDHFVGEYYVKFNDAYKAEVDQLISEGMDKATAEKEAPLMKETQQMLQDWEAGKPEVIELWKMMNSWVYEGFDVTYKRIGSDFQKMYYESDTYLLGKQFVEEGLQKGVFYKKDDGSVWIDLTADGLDEKLVLRKDGTSVYITQDIGLAQQKYDEFRYDQSIYVIADEQNYHMKVLKLILQKLGKPYAEGVYHLSYGMVELPTGRMKSREGTVVDADDMVDEMVNVAKQKTEELGKVKDFSDAELKELYDTIALGALKFFLLRVDPKKKMIFNPEESIDFHGFTGPFVQYTHARIRSILRKSEVSNQQSAATGLLKLEKDIVIMLEQYPTILEQAVAEHNPSVIAIYVFNLAKAFNTFYTEHSVMNAESEEKKQLRLQISEMTANVIASGMSLLGIKVPERM